MNPRILSRKKRKDVLSLAKQNPVLQFQNEKKALVSFQIMCMSPNSNQLIIMCRARNKMGSSAFAFGSNFTQAFNNMKKKYNQKFNIQ